MRCLSEDQIQQLIDDEKLMTPALNEHLAECDRCSEKERQYKKIDHFFYENLLVDAPAGITEYVMNKIMMQKPSLWSILGSIAASLSAIVFLIFAYYGFSPDSLSNAFNVLSGAVLGGIHGFVVLLSNLFEYTLVFFKTVNKFFKVLFGVGVDAEFIGLFIAVFTALLLLPLYKLYTKMKYKTQ